MQQTSSRPFFCFCFSLYEVNTSGWTCDKKLYKIQIIDPVIRTILIFEKVF